MSAGPPFPGSPQGFPLVTVQGHPDDVMDFLTEYCSGDHEQALDLFEAAVVVDFVAGDLEIVQVSGLDWVPRADR